MADVIRPASRRRAGRKTKLCRPSLSYTGCWTCRKRRVKCDERPVACKCCENAGLACGGYDVELIWDAGERGEGSGSRRFRRQIRPDSSTCRLMTDEEISQTLTSVDRCASSSEDVIAGPFAVFKFGSDDDAGRLRLRDAGSRSVESPSLPEPSDDNLEQDDYQDGQASEDPFNALPGMSVALDDGDLNHSQLAGDFSARTSWPISPHPQSDYTKLPLPQETLEWQPALVSPRICELTSESQHQSSASGVSSSSSSSSLLESSEFSSSIQVMRHRPSVSIPRQVHHHLFAPDNRGSTANLLINHYANHMVHLMQPITHQSNPFERIYLPLAISGSSDLGQEASSEVIFSPRVAVCHSLLAAAANNLQGLGNGEGTLRATACYHKQKALTALRHALASRSGAYKDLMTAMLALVSVDIINGGTQDHWVHLDAAMRLQASRHFAKIISSETRQLNSICTMLHLFAQTALLAPEPRPWTESCDAWSTANLDRLSPSIEYIYGISTATATSLLKLYRLTQHLCYYTSLEYPESLLQACEDLGDELCSWSIALEEFSAIGREQTSMLKIARAQATAFHHAALIYYYRSIQQCARRDLHSEQLAVLAAMDEAELLKRSAGDDVAMPAPITWPAFIASCEAVGEDRVGWREWWARIQRYRMYNYARQQEIVHKIWEETDRSNAPSDWRETLVKLEIRVLPV